MDAVSIIGRKRDGHALTNEEVKFVVEGFTSGAIPDYQMSALLMAIYLRGMDSGETACLTEHMLRSGGRLSWRTEGGPVVDKHSTGGVGDKVSLVLAPLLACCGVRVPMVSGRGLGPTGGTLDKLESIDGLRTDLEKNEIYEVVRRTGCVITGATSDIAPADKRLYALRDVTGTVASIPLITSSIMSKKLAAGLSALVLDVKFGSGAFMKHVASARALAESLVNTGTKIGVNTIALLTDMNQPLGQMIGNAVEVNESIDALRDQGPSDLLEVTLALGASLLVQAGMHGTRDAARLELLKHLSNGNGLERFDAMVAAQGGSLERPRRVASRSDVMATRAGVVKRVDAQALGQAVIDLGGGRRQVADTVNHAVGLQMLVRVGDVVDVGQPLAGMFADGPCEPVRQRVHHAIEIVEEPVPPRELIADCVGERS